MLTLNYFMRRYLKVFAWLVVYSIQLSFQSCTTTTEDNSLIIHNVTLIDAKNGQQKAMSIRIEENKITEVTASTNIKIAGGATVIDGTGKYLIPGLWDAHIHLTYNNNLTPVMFDLFLKYGITSVRDTGGELDLVLPLKEIADKSPKNTPRVKISGPLLDGIPTVYDGANPRVPKLGIGLKSVEDAKRQIDELAESGVDFLKVYEMLSPEVFNAILKQADSLGLPVTGHVPLSIDAITASKSGMRSMEHLRNLEMAFTKDWDSLLKVRQKMLLDGVSKSGGKLRANIHAAQRAYALENSDEAQKKLVLDQLDENEVWQVPTLNIMTVASLRFFGTDEWKATFDELPDSVSIGWKERLERYLKSPINEEMATYGEWMLQMIKTLKEANVPIMAGTDTPIFFLTPGYSLHEELALLVKGGLTPLEALDAATLQPAKYFNMENELGTIEKGMLADLVLLNANPIENIRNTTNIKAVIKDGKLHNQKALDSISNRLKSL